MITIFGEAGVGKSALAANFFREFVSHAKVDFVCFGTLSLCGPGPFARDTSGTASPTVRISIPGRSQSLILRTLGLLERKRQDLQQVLRSRSAGRHDLAAERRLFGLQGLPGQDDLAMLKVMLSAAIRSLATMVIRSYAKHCAALTANRSVATAIALRRRLLECIYRAIPRTELVCIPTHASSAYVVPKPAFPRHRQCDGTRRLRGHSVM